MCVHYDTQAFALVIYSPESSKEDQWTSFDGKISARLDEIFKDEGGFDKYIEAHIPEIKACYKTIKQIV
jgi:hypothetical protein